MAFVTSGAAISARRSAYGEAVCARPPSGAPAATSTKASAGTPRMAATSGADEVPDMGKRNLLNAILLGTTSMATVAIGGPFAAFFVPAGGGSGGGGVVALDAAGNAVKKAQYLETHNAGSRELVQGLRGDATYLIVTEDKDLEYYALNAVCTHLGCVVPWSKAENKFKCPCHGSQYAPTGAVVRGPAPLPLALERCETDDSGNVILKSWKETDFRTNAAPWWNF